jgi:hypothetical protein
LISEELITLGLTGVGVAIGYFLKDFIDRRKEAETARIADRRDHYRTLMLCLKSLSEGQRDKDELLRFEYTFPPRVRIVVASIDQPRGRR